MVIQSCTICRSGCLLEAEEALEGMIQVCQLMQVILSDANYLWLLPIYPHDDISLSSNNTIVLFQLEVANCSEPFLQGDILFVWNLHLTKVHHHVEVPAPVATFFINSSREGRKELSFDVVKCVVQNLFHLSSQRNHDMMASIIKVSRLTSLLMSPSLLPPVTLLHLAQLNSNYPGLCVVNAYIIGAAPNNAPRDEVSGAKRQRGHYDHIVQLSDGTGTVSAYMGDHTLFLCSQLSWQSITCMDSHSLMEYTLLVNSYCYLDNAERVFRVEAVSDVSVRAQAIATKKSFPLHP